MYRMYAQKRVLPGITAALPQARTSSGMAAMQNVLTGGGGGGGTKHEQEGRATGNI